MADDTTSEGAEAPVLAERIGAVLRITLNRPDRLNSLDAPTRRALAEALVAADTARAVVLTGAGEAFSAGQDLAGGKRLADIDLARLQEEELAPLIRLVHDCPAPVIAAVNGAAAGTGLALVLAADIALAAHSAVFAAPQARVGLMPEAGITWLLPRRVGRARAMAMMLLGERVPAATARDWGLVWEVVPDTALDDRAMALATRLADGPSAAHSMLKAAVAAGEDATLAAHLAMEADLLGDLGRSRDFREGMLAHLENRPPRFEGR